MNLLALENSRHIELAADWLSREENYQWLSFGNGVQRLTPVMLKVMAQRDVSVLRLFTADDSRPVGIVGLSDIDRRFRTGTLWFALGEKQYSRKGYTSRAAARMLEIGFHSVGLRAILATTVETNHVAVSVLRRLRFQPIGRQRLCHCIGTRALDRLLFDLLDSEYEDLDYVAS